MAEAQLERLAAALDIDPTAAQRERGRSRVRHRRIAEHAAVMAALSDTGRSPAEIAAATGLSGRRVSDILAAARARGEAHREGYGRWVRGA